MERVGGFIPKALLPDLWLALLLLVMLTLLRTLVPQESLKTKPSHPPDAPVQQAGQPSPHPAAPRLVAKGDTINGERLEDPILIERIERIAATIPDRLLASVRRGASVRYLAHAFGVGDDAPVSYGLFAEPAAALAFGCALDDHLAAACQAVAVPRPGTTHEIAPGVHCTPLGIAMGAPAYEPDRCDAGD